VTLDSFTVGRFASYTHAGCPDGDLHITESDRPAVSGGWCGTSWAPAHYYSETNSITLLVRLYTLSSLDNTGYNFDFRLGYKMLNRNRAVVRYGEQKMFASEYTRLLLVVVVVDMASETRWTIVVRRRFRNDIAA